MQYFTALKLGQKRVATAREYLNKLTNGNAMPALALKDTKTGIWEPVGEENHYAVITAAGGYVLSDSSGYTIALCDKDGLSKAIAQGLSDEQKDKIVETLKKEQIPEYTGKVKLPV